YKPYAFPNFYIHPNELALFFYLLLQFRRIREKNRILRIDITISFYPKNQPLNRYHLKEHHQ
ncbi:MAG: hypothetical protein K2J59_00820, partial [Eubacterium sp.]|nr:hypothetical protein [Eubacterium sp.]